MMCPSGFTSRFSDSGGIYLNQMASPSLADQIQNEFRDNADVSAVNNLRKDISLLKELVREEKIKTQKL